VNFQKRIGVVRIERLAQALKQKIWRLHVVRRRQPASENGTETFKAGLPQQPPQ
jgi:hypothetical protein